MSKRTPYFQTVDTKPDFPKLEKELLQKWYKSGIVNEYLNKNRNSTKRFSFMDGPITANNPMGVHHGWGRTYKDLWQRFNTQRGFKQRYQNGFDCQGLWVEVEVEKELGLKTKKDIENLVAGSKEKSIEMFVGLCKKRVFKYAKIQTEQSKRLGYFVDWDNSYYTLSDGNNYMIWHFLQKCHEKGLIYKGRDSVPWCPRCGTAISQHEMLTEDYKEIVHESIYYALPIVGRKNEFLLVWTTTPWTIPANIAVAVDPKLSYSLVRNSKGLNYWVATDAVKRIFKGEHKLVRDLKGDKLVGLTYSGAFDHLPRVKKVKDENPDKFHTVIPADPMVMPISYEEGTGLVHTAVSAGAEDFKMGKNLGLPMIEIIDEEANYLNDLDEFSGKNAKKHPELILDYLRERGEKGENWVFLTQNYKHRYPACWRCKTELVWRVVDEWYIAIDPVRNDMKKVAKKINWLPKFGLKRELDWLDNMHDWLISKKRYWGLALPIWECKKCGHFEVIGSFAELKSKAVEGWDEFEGKSPHKPWIDKVKIKCTKCGEIVERIPDVGNPWLDAGIVSFSTISSDNTAANPNKSDEPLYLKDKKEWQKWFPVDFITESFPGQFKNWFYSLIAMSTVLENSEPAKNILGFGTLLGEDGRPMHKSWGNSIEFNEGADNIGVDVMRWMYVRQNPADNLLFGYRVANEVRRKFHLKLWNVYNFFVTYANSNSWKPAGNSKSSTHVLDRWITARLNEIVDLVTQKLIVFDAYTSSGDIEQFVDDLSNWYVRRSRDRLDNEFFTTTYHVLVTLCKLVAPYNPFISEIIYTNLTGQKSVHLSDWPDTKALNLKEKELISQIAKARGFVEQAHALRKAKEIPVRQPLSSVKIISKKKVLSDEIKKLIADELNVKEVIVVNNGRSLVTLDTKMTPLLEEEGKTRELIRKIQEERKNMGISFTQEVILTLPWIPTNKELVQILKTKTLAKEIETGEFKVKAD